jgi:hypothetical protein
MNIDKALKKQLETIFSPLNKIGAEKAFPPPSSLSTALEKLIPAKGVTIVSVKPQVASLFATAAVEVWLRAVHSFLVSASLTGASPIWASATGYYSSHYSVRGLAHLLGHFQLFRRKRVVRLDLQSGRHICSFDPKQGADREHRLYWKLVKRDAHFVSDPLFTENDPELDASDVGHRDRANYADHLDQFPFFRALDAPVLKARVQFISQIEFTTPPIPKRSHFPDVGSVQVVAYHRLVKFRKFLDEVLGGSNRFWNVHRNPTWTGEMIDFQLTEQGGLASLNN